MCEGLALDIAIAPESEGPIVDFPKNADSNERKATPKTGSMA
jgi:D-alanyl-D-alanine dipeptidase